MTRRSRYSDRSTACANTEIPAAGAKFINLILAPLCPKCRKEWSGAVAIRKIPKAIYRTASEIDAMIRQRKETAE